MSNPFQSNGHLTSTKGTPKILVRTTIWGVYFKSTVAVVTSYQNPGTNFMNTANSLPAVFYQS